MKSILGALSVVAFLTSCSLGSGHVTKGMHFYSIGDFAKAKTELNQANLNSLGHYSKKEYYTILGNCYNELNLLDSAIILHKKSLAIDPNYAEAWVNLGIVYRLSGKFDQAMSCYTKANNIDPNDPELHASMGALYVYMEKPQLAVKHLEKAIEIDASLVIAHSNYALALAYVGEFVKAEKELKLAESMGYPNGIKIRERIKLIQSE